MVEAAHPDLDTGLWRTTYANVVQLLQDRRVNNHWEPDHARDRTTEVDTTVVALDALFLHHLTSQDREHVQAWIRRRLEPISVWLDDSGSTAPDDVQAGAWNVFKLLRGALQYGADHDGGGVRTRLSQYGRRVEDNIADHFDHEYLIRSCTSVGEMFGAYKSVRTTVPPSLAEAAQEYWERSVARLLAESTRARADRGEAALVASYALIPLARYYEFAPAGSEVQHEILEGIRRTLQIEHSLAQPKVLARTAMAVAVLAESKHEPLSYADALDSIARHTNELVSSWGLGSAARALFSGLVAVGVPPAEILRAQSSKSETAFTLFGLLEHVDRCQDRTHHHEDCVFARLEAKASWALISKKVSDNKALIEPEPKRGNDTLRDAGRERLREYVSQRGFRQSRNSGESPTP